MGVFLRMDRITGNFSLLVKIFTPFTKKIYGIINYIFLFQSVKLNREKT
ncbi:hypothetical protein HMPREF0322_04409 [Desulfitobacterium hafniense DP7]|uniref:Uncharacterized protein n=1 Tax=Desulfitobacterium hafniense DP7 TaxID=537010 RepID=G9XTV1_DESHA|nr:hypothetical protein HMPREF0322_04409 [Desulfitobacterium hafniense DP7]